MPLAACRRGHACLRVGRFPVAANTADVAVRRVWHLPTQSRHIGLRRTPIRQSPARTCLWRAHVGLIGVQIGTRATRRQAARPRATAIGSLSLWYAVRYAVRVRMGHMTRRAAYAAPACIRQMKL